MGKYKIDHKVFNTRKRGFYIINQAKTFNFGNNLEVDLDLQRKDFMYYIDCGTSETAKSVSREEFKLELELRKSTVWKAINEEIE